MNPRRFKLDAETFLNRIVRKADTISAADADAYADLVQGLVQIISAISKVQKGLKLKLPHGTFGCWDYPNAQYKVPPTEADIPELCRQKLLRDPRNGLFASHEKTREWFVTKGWIEPLT